MIFRQQGVPRQRKQISNLTEKRRRSKQPFDYLNTLV